MFKIFLIEEVKGSQIYCCSNLLHYVH